MKYTLYIDESGDFESQRGQWLISGVLFSESYKVCENTFTKKFKSAPAELNLKSIKQFHLTDFRKEFGHDKAVGMANQFLKKLNNLPFDYYCLVAINYSKHSLSTREKTYRLMLSDLLALCDTVLPEGEVISNLDLIIAARTIDGELQTSISNVNQDVINSLPLALEVDLTSKGMVELIGKHLKVQMDYANNSWGLVTADFIANLNYHHHHKNEKELLEQLASQGRFSRFESFGNHEERRANIAKRNGDLSTSLYRWLVIHSKQQTTRTEIAIQSVLFEVFNTTGTTGYLITLEAVIDRLWRGFNKPNQYLKMVTILRLLINQLSIYESENEVGDFNNIIFKLRNLILIIENHLGETKSALHTSTLQNELLTRLSSNPEFFSRILDFKISEIETYINLLDFEKALLLSNKFSELIDSYNAIWTLLIDDIEQSEFDSSRASIKSKMTNFRCKVLCLQHGIKSDELIKKVNELENIISNKNDLSRLSNYKVMYLLKSNQPLTALSVCLEKIKKQDYYRLGFFDFFWFLRALNDALLTSSVKNTAALIRIVEAQVSYIDLNTQGHPVDLILRELALFEFQNFNKSKALKYIKRSSKAFNLGNSEIAIWLLGLNRLHEDFFNGINVDECNYFDELATTSFLCKVIEDKNWSSVLTKYRFYSPY